MVADIMLNDYLHVDEAALMKVDMGLPRSIATLPAAVRCIKIIESEKSKKIRSLYKYKPSYTGTLTTLASTWSTLEWHPGDRSVRRHLLDLVVGGKHFANSLRLMLYANENTRCSTREGAEAGYLSPTDAALVAHGFFVQATNVVPCQDNRWLPRTFMTPMGMTPVFTAVKKN